MSSTTIGVRAGDDNRVKLIDASLVADNRPSAESETILGRKSLDNHTNSTRTDLPPKVSTLEENPNLIDSRVSVGPALKNSIDPQKISEEPDNLIKNVSQDCGNIRREILKEVARKETDEGPRSVNPDSSKDLEIAQEISVDSKIVVTPINSKVDGIRPDIESSAPNISTDSNIVTREENLEISIQPVPDNSKITSNILKLQSLKLFPLKYPRILKLLLKKFPKLLHARFLQILILFPKIQKLQSLKLREILDLFQTR